MPSPIDTITIKGFRSIASVEALPLGPMNVLIGANGAGKSNFIGFFDFLRAIGQGRLGVYTHIAGGADRLLHFGSKTTSELAVYVSFRGGVNQYDLALIPTAGDALVPSREAVYTSNRPGPTAWDLRGENGEAGISSINHGVAQLPALWIQARLDDCRVYHFHDTSASSRMKKTAKLADNRFLRPDASNIASFLYHLNTRHNANFRLIEKTVRLVAPFFHSFQLEPIASSGNGDGDGDGDGDTIRLEWRHNRSDDYFDADSLSDGTLRFIALATLFLQPEEFLPSTIVLDEPELGLHPYAITLLASLARQAAAKTQVVMATQSPTLLDHFQPEEVLVAELVDDATQIRRLDASALATWLEDYSLGELWEKNELGGRPGGGRG